MPIDRASRPWGLWLLIAICATESLLVAVWAVYSIVSVPTAPAGELPTAIALIVVVLVLCAGLVAVTVGLWRGRRWARSGAVTWQVLQGALAIGCFQGFFAEPALGWALLLPAVVAFICALTRPVVAATRR